MARRRKKVNKNELTLVVGGTGKTGRRVVDRLKERGLSFRVGSRSAEPAFDWGKRETWQPCLRDVTQAYVTYYPDLCVPGALETMQSFFAEAVNAGVRKLVLLSGRGEIEAERVEDALKASGVDWTILRCSFFCQNFDDSFMLEPIIAGEVALPVRPVREPFVDVEDIADVAIAALTDDRHSGQLYELTGRRGLSFADAIAEVARATQRNIRFLSIPAEAYRGALLEAHVPEDVVELILYLFGTVLDGRNEPLTNGVQRALGRPPRDFSEYVQRTAASGIWGAPDLRR
jgi:uncharacterized protein YbjT (DUF2867 family)